MTKKEALLALIAEQGVLPLYFHENKEVSLAVLRALYAAGIRAAEYTNRGATALENFKWMKAACNKEMQDMQLGVGTIKNGDTASLFIDAGADFVVSPGLVEAVATVAGKHNLLWVPGCMTPTEILKAGQLGATLIKLFPANMLGPSFLHHIKDIFPELLFMPTGGVDPEINNLRSWFKAGVTAVGIGGKLVTKTAMDNHDFEGITDAATRLLALLKTVR